MDWDQAIQYAQIVAVAYTILPGNLTNSAGTQFKVGATDYTIITTIYANDLATDMNPTGASNQVSIGLICQNVATGELVIAFRGTEGILEWVHDAQFDRVPCPFLAGSGQTEDGFTAMYLSAATAQASGSPTVVQWLTNLSLPTPPTSVTICGHSLGGALATLLALDVAANSPFKNPMVYTYASPRTGDSMFVGTYNQVVKSTFRIANRVDLVPKLPFPPFYGHVDTAFDLNPVQLIPPKILLKFDLGCQHALESYLFMMSMNAGGPVIPLDPKCVP